MTDTDIIVAPDDAWLLPLADWVSPRGLRDLPDDLPYEDWERLGKYIGAVFTASKWALGDWLNFGEHHYGEKYTQAAEATGRSAEGLMNIASIARAYPDQTSRNRDVAFSVYEALAPLARTAPAEADSVLARAEEAHWTAAEVKAELAPSVQAKPVVERLTIDEFAEAFERWKDAGHYNEFRAKGAAMFEAFIGWLRK